MQGDSQTIVTLARLRGLSTRQLAQRAGVEYTGLTRVLKGARPLTPETERRLVAALFPAAFQEAGDDNRAA